MIFATVGTQIHFDRMMTVLEEWASQSGNKVFCQTGPTSVEFQKCEHKEFITPKEYAELMSRCDIIVAHAGIGSILSAMEYQKPIIIFPRKASLGEHRNEHQLATAKQFQDKPGIYVAYTNEDLLNLLENHRNLSAGENLSPYANDSLIRAVKEFIHS
jgi:UDP-N-acetylglucosamine transferase subunit ALG13